MCKNFTTTTAPVAMRDIIHWPILAIRQSQWKYFYKQTKKKRVLARNFFLIYTWHIIYSVLFQRTPRTRIITFYDFNMALAQWLHNTCMHKTSEHRLYLSVFHLNFQWFADCTSYSGIFIIGVWRWGWFYVTVDRGTAHIFISLHVSV